MPRRRRVPKPRAKALTVAERMDLLHGRRGAFNSEAKRRAAWAKHRDTLLRNRRRGRPAAFWDYEGPPELRQPQTAEPSSQLVETWGWNRAAQIAADTDLAARRRRWLALDQGAA